MKAIQRISMTVAVLCAAAALLMALCGCEGMGSGSKPNMSVYNFNVAKEAKSVFNIGNAGVQAPMYQSSEEASEGPAGNGAGSAPYYTGGQMPVTAGANGGTAQGKYVMQAINDGYKRSAETDVATLATLAQGLTQSQTGVTAPVSMRESTGTGTMTQTGSPQMNQTKQVNPNLALSKEGTAQQVNPTSTQAGSGSTPGAVQGGTGNGTQTTTPNSSSGSSGGTDGGTTNDGAMTTPPADERGVSVLPACLGCGLAVKSVGDDGLCRDCRVAEVARSFARARGDAQ